jgi:hypothetical protein
MVEREVQNLKIRDLSESRCHLMEQLGERPMPDHEVRHVEQRLITAQFIWKIVLDGQG